MDETKWATKPSVDSAGKEHTTVQVDPPKDGERFPLGLDELVRLMDFTETPSEKVVEILASWGGVEGVCTKLDVDPDQGLNDRELDDPYNARKEKYGENMVSQDDASVSAFSSERDLRGFLLILIRFLNQSYT
jgi:hypothetical protein